MTGVPPALAEEILRILVVNLMVTIPYQFIFWVVSGGGRKRAIKHLCISFVVMLTIVLLEVMAAFMFSVLR